MTDTNSPQSWNSIWNKRRRLFFNRMRSSLTKALRRSLEGYAGRFLEAGCGESYLLHNLKKNFSVVGIDFSRAACKLSKRRRVNVVLGDIHHLPFREGRFDVVFNQSVIQTEEHPVETIREMMRVVKPGGDVLFTVPKKFSIFHVASKFERMLPLWPRVHQEYWNEKEIKDIFGGWDVSVKKVWHHQLLWIAIKRPKK